MPAQYTKLVNNDASCSYQGKYHPGKLSPCRTPRGYASRIIRGVTSLALAATIALSCGSVSYAKSGKPVDTVIESGQSNAKPAPKVAPSAPKVNRSIDEATENAANVFIEKYIEIPRGQAAFKATKECVQADVVSCAIGLAVSASIIHPGEETITDADIPLDWARRLFVSRFIQTERGGRLTDRFLADCTNSSAQSCMLLGVFMFGNKYKESK